ncbi:MAG: bifunctional serine/threonine-protein kinase/universal stress protein [Paenacidovorax caeni]
MKLLAPGTEVDGFVVRECIHAGGMAHIYAVAYAQQARDPGFSLAMKIPRMTAGDGAENIVSFEVELQILPVLSGPHVPRFVAAGDLLRLPYLVMEYVPGQTLQHWLDQPERPDAATVAQLGSAMALAAHSLHQQNCCHLDLKPGNVLIRPDGSAVLLDFGLSCHAHYPDLLAEEMRKAVGSPAWIAPEQVVGVRGDLRSDIFAIGVMLYELATGELPFGAPTTPGGLRQRLWMTPAPPREHRPDLPEWLQEIILRCLEPEAAQRYLGRAPGVRPGESGPGAHHRARPAHARPRRARAPQALAQGRGMHYQPSPLPTSQIEEAPILMVAVPHQDVQDATLYSLREAVARSLGIRPGARLACVTVLALGQQHLGRRAQRDHAAPHAPGPAQAWAQSPPLAGHSVSYHVLEASDVGQALVRYAEGNRVGLMILGAATHGLQLQRFIDTVPIRVAREAPCTVILVKQCCRSSSCTSGTSP